MSDKTEEPTPRRLRKAREEGDSGVSAFAAQAVSFLVAVAVVPSAVVALAARASEDLRRVLARAASPGVSGGAGGIDPVAWGTEIIALVAPPLLAVALAGAAAHAIQTGGVLATRRLTPKLDRLDVLAGLRGLVSATRLVAVARAVVGAGVVGWLAFAALRDHVVDVARVAGRIAPVPRLLAEIAGGLAWRAALVGLALGSLDLLVTRRAWARKLRMSKDEVRREHRDAEGDPQLKAARERAYQELLAEATIAQVRDASVVVVNPTHLACALRYRPESGDDAPVLVASGQGALAERIRAAAAAGGVPVVQDVSLARALVELRVGEAIPEALYEAVAEVLREIAAG